MNFNNIINVLLNIKGFKNHAFYVSDHENLSNHKCRHLCRWIKENGRYPSQASKDQKEKRLVTWLDRQRQAKLEKNERKFYLSNLIIVKEEGFPDLFDQIDREKESNKICCELCQWIKKNSRYPSQASKDQKEKRLVTWLDRQRQAKLEKNERKFYLSNLIIVKEEGFPDLFDQIDREKESNKICYELCQWIKKNSRYPSQASKDQKEKKLVNWLYDQRKAKSGKSKSIFYPSNLVIAQEHGFPDLFDLIDREKESNKICYELCQWIKENGRYPSKHSKTPKEKRLGNSLNHQRRAKLGKGTSQFYDSNLVIAQEHGFPDLFERTR